ncbi:zf-HC2 domain-containing protein [Curvibacter sp. CHRR-16]|uniref:anti-sigma factor family protein n=1 Tax=Curvibacter sp. CHRR-16 TaxID=2835872 RepID=UPI001BDA17AC|nr:zf-HC2 domain-containing protein [Curvibacter sp. CHRR-16]MBT0570098.1 zf-HC2 domain-containing protein [Curvibacter sp. CHRR-16]
MTPLRLSCKKATALLVAREDRRLALLERLALGVHLRLCDACTRMDGQMRVMQRGLAQWRNYREDESRED